MIPPGILLVGHTPPARLLEMARCAEDNGYGAAWVADERFFREVYAVLALLAAGTSTIALGPCVTDPFSRHPAMTAAAIATIDEISGGRALLGFGAGLSGFAQMGIAPKKSVLAMREALDLIHRLLAGETVEATAETLQFHGGRLGFTPGRPAIPTWIASNGPLGQALGGRVADAVIMEGCGTPREAAAFATRVHAAAAKAGRAPGAVACIARLNCCIAGDTGAAHDLLRLRAAKTLTSGFMGFQTLAEDGLLLPDNALAQVAGLPYGAPNEPYEAILPFVEDRHVDAVTLAGTPCEVAARVTALLEAGIDGLIISPMALPGADVLDTVRSFGALWPDAARKHAPRRTTP